MKITAYPSVFPGGHPVDEAREACHALKGPILRQEVYANGKVINQRLTNSVKE